MLMVLHTDREITFVLGGVRSGNSRFAQALGDRHWRVLFLATARESDEEMRAKAARHRADRTATWHTLEEPVNLTRLLRDGAAGYGIVLIDCLTLWVANLLSERESEWSEWAEDFYRGLAELRSPVVIVSNEVGSGIVPAYPLGRIYRDLLAEVNQRLAALASNVVLMVAGIPLAVKGAV